MFTSNVTCAIVPGDVQFNDTSTNPAITDYYWDFGDGGNSTEKNPIHQYNITGVFPVNHSTTSPSNTTWSNQSSYMTIRATGDTCGGGTVFVDEGKVYETGDSSFILNTVAGLTCFVVIFALNRRRK